MSEKQSILIVDDEMDMCWALESILVLEGYKIHTATSGKEGLKLIQQLQSNIRLLFLDAKLPDIDGLMFAEFIKQQYPQIKIIIITGYYYRDSDAVRKGLANSIFDGFIGKPFNISEIRSAIETIALSQ
ncbi:MAG: response regulator [Candidatus Brocadia sp. AMX2]|uniref:Response regulator receiver protein n=1 Tax=Candidatus Brocadia sinica JPN1 TaxID=1197129 RepID=A0ABQ0JTU5_9BACT|nr:MULTISPECIES: response regulator [Brocadia]KXK32320.1 MAG: two-component response regulator [Candidatus Brocadia sinica]MBC6933055.1 response regulator [Candidatus Brocadia sp.]MBL1169060.1 response regulator [Candidatus Brocadia sp. AMX1]NOG41945.1 response regulator [Planctomycetota bacterium]KAA0243836.1 MAG: response regulator [Candidatus Brocadia sp. AMX2]